MADETTTTGRTATGILDADHDANPDPLTEEPGAHPVGTGVGAAGGGTLGAVIGGAVGGPVGAMIGAAIGGVTGGLAGKGVAESVNPTEEDAYWRDNHAARPYAQGRSYDDLRPAYQYGWESRGQHADRSWNDAESDLERGWNQARGNTSLGWHEAKDATRDAWERVDSRFRGTAGGSSEQGSDEGSVTGAGNRSDWSPITGAPGTSGGAGTGTAGALAGGYSSTGHQTVSTGSGLTDTTSTAWSGGGPSDLDSKKR
jgi:hypothetical protein